MAEKDAVKRMERLSKPIFGLCLKEAAFRLISNPMHNPIFNEEENMLYFLFTREQLARVGYRGPMLVEERTRLQGRLDGWKVDETEKGELIVFKYE